MSKVRAILGDVDAAALGVCYAHEHVVIDRSVATENNPDFLLNDIGRIARELDLFRSAGGRAMIDTMPMECGRNVRLLAEVSKRSGVHIVCPTGIHLEKYYPADHWSHAAGVSLLADRFTQEIEHGMEGTAHRAGVIKVAGGLDQLNQRQRRCFTAAAIASHRTGCPIITHTEQGTASGEQVDLLLSNDADARHVVLSHLDRNPDVELHRGVLRRGVRLEYDSAFRWKSGDSNPTLALLVQLLPEFPEQIMLGMDAARHTYWRSYGGKPGLDYLLTTFTQSMKQAGITDELLHRIFVDNPAQAYAFADNGTVRPHTPSQSEKGNDGDHS